MFTPLIAAAATTVSLIIANAAEAKSIWLKCGSQEVNLDSDRERFSLTYNGKIYQGSAFFSPGQINFEFQWFEAVRGQVGIKYAYAIDRKSLAYTKTSLSKNRIESAMMLGAAGHDWEPQEIESNPERGKCSIIKTPPTAENQI